MSALPTDKVIKLSEKYISRIPKKGVSIKSNKKVRYKPSVKYLKKEVYQAHCVLGKPAYDLKNENRLPFFMLVNYLGGPALNSRLNLLLREKYGFVYNAEAGYSAYKDSGLFYIYFGTEEKQLKKVIRLVQRGVEKFSKKAVDYCAAK